MITRRIEHPEPDRIARRRDAGLSYVEVLLAISILAGSVLSMGYALQSTRDIENDGMTRSEADYLLDDAIAWIYQLHRSDPDEPTNFGTEAGDVTKDDVDDLDGLTEKPPTDRAGKVFGTEWARNFTVNSVALDSPTVPTTKGSTNLMRVTVSVARDGVVMASETILLWRPQ